MNINNVSLAVMHALLFTPAGRITRGGVSEVRWGLNALFEGDPGGGKTSVVKSKVASITSTDRVGVIAPWQCKVMVPGDGEGQFGIVPVPRGGGDVSSCIDRVITAVQNGAEYSVALAEQVRLHASEDMTLSHPRPDWTRMFDGGRPGVVFCDEISTAPGHIQAPMLTLCSERTIAGFTFHGRVRVLGAMNPVHQAAGGQDISLPLANRFGHFPWGNMTNEQHCAYMLGIDDEASDDLSTDGDAEEARVMAAWKNGAWAQAVGLETEFHRSLPGFKNMCPKADEVTVGMAWASDRTWEMATRAYASSIVHGLSATDRDNFVASFIGQKAYEAFAIFCEQVDMPSITDVADGKVEFAWNPRRLDRSAAIVNAWAALVAPKTATDRDARAERLWEALGKTQNFDIVAPAAQVLTKAGLAFSKAARPVMIALRMPMELAGVKGAL